MRANQRKLLGIIGALVVPIALVVGLYADSGDLFKGYLTFDESSSGAGDSQVETFLFGDSSFDPPISGVISGSLDDSDSLTGDFNDYFSEQDQESIFDPSTQCPATDMDASDASYDMKNLSDQYKVLTNLLQDRGNTDYIDHFNKIVKFYTNDGDEGAGADITTGLISKLDSTNVGGKISYEDIQKMTLLNLLAYTLATCDSHGGVVTNPVLNTDVVREFFEDNFDHKERLFSTIQYDTENTNPVSYHRLVKPGTSSDGTLQPDLSSWIPLYDYQATKDELERIKALAEAEDATLPLEIGTSSITASNIETALEFLSGDQFRFYGITLYDYISANTFGATPASTSLEESEDITSIDDLTALIDGTLKELKYNLEAKVASSANSNLYVDFSATTGDRIIPETITINTDIQDPVAKATLLELSSEDELSVSDRALVNFAIKNSSSIHTAITSTTDALDITSTKTATPKYYKAGSEITSTSSDPSPRAIYIDMRDDASTTDENESINYIELDSTKEHVLIVTLYTDTSDDYKHNFLEDVTVGSGASAETFNANDKQVYIYRFIDNTFTAADIDITPATSEDDTEPNIGSSIDPASDEEKAVNPDLTHKITTTINPGTDGPPLPANGYTTAIVRDTEESSLSFFNFFQTANALSAVEATTICDTPQITFDGALRNNASIESVVTIPDDAGTYYVCQGINGVYSPVATIDVLESGDVIIQDGVIDTDSDGLTENTEAALGTDDTKSDSDDDGLTDSEEDLNRDGQISETETDPTDDDTDEDGTKDGEDAFPLDATEDTDTDGDRTGDNTDTDKDGDGLSDQEEEALGTSPLLEDTNADGKKDGDEDTDGDGVTNLEELLAGSDPTDINETPDSIDIDGDGKPNDSDDDIDGDGILNGDDAFPLDNTEDTDTDEDGLGDNADDDDDNDGLTDVDELTLGTNPKLADSDGDSVSDKEENDAGSDPNDPTETSLEPRLDSSVDTTVETGTTVLLTIEGDNLVESTSEGSYELQTANGVVVKEATQIEKNTNGAIILNFGEVLPCISTPCAPYELFMQADGEDSVDLGLTVSIAKFNVISPQNGVSLTRPDITFQCLESDDYTYQVTLKQGSTLIETVSDITCVNEVATASLTQDLTAGATYTVHPEVVDKITDQSLGNNYNAHSFTTSNTFLLSGEQMQSLTYSCGQQRPETTDANGVIIPGTSNVVIAGQTANCAINNPYTNATINSNYKIKFGENTPDTNAVQIQSVSTGFSAINIPVPADLADNKIVIFVPTSSGAVQKFTASSTLTIEASNGGSGTEVTGADLTDLVEIDIDNDIEIGEEIDMEVFIPEGLNVHFLQVAFEGNEDDRDTEDEKGMIFRYCQEDITDLLETRRQRNTMEDLCEDFSDDDVLEGPLEVEIENFDTSSIAVEGDYDIVIDMFIEGEAEQTAKSNTAYAQDIQLLQTRIRIENAFEAEDNEFDAGRGGWGSIGFPGFNPGIMVGSIQQCGQIFVDLQGGHQICQDIMYLYDKNLYQGIQMGPNIVSGISQPAVRAHIFAFVAQVLNTYRNAPRMAPDLYALSQYYSDLPFEVISNPQQQWWVAPLYTLSTYNYVTGDSQYRARPFDPITQAQAAKLIGMATGLIPSQLAQMNPWYSQIVSQYLTYGLNLNPDAPATMGDILILLSRSMQIMENPSLYSVQNPYMGTSGYQSNGYNTQFVQGGYGTQYYSQAGYGQGYGQPYGQTQGYFY